MLPIEKLEALVARAKELDRILCEPDATSDMQRYRKFTKGVFICSHIFGQMA